MSYHHRLRNRCVPSSIFSGIGLPSHFSSENDPFQNLHEWFGFEKANRGGNYQAACDIQESEDAYQVFVDLPGVDPSDLNVETLGGRLTITAERKSVVRAHEPEQVVVEEGDQATDTPNNVRHIERRYGKFTRAFTLPDGVDPDTISAQYENGVLRLTVPKPEAAKPQRVGIDIVKN